MLIFSLVYEKVDLNGFSPSFFMLLLFNTIVVDLEKKSSTWWPEGCAF